MLNIFNRVEVLWEDSSERQGAGSSISKGGSVVRLDDVHHEATKIGTF